MTRNETEQHMRRQRILDAASAVFAAHGYDAASMNEIARASEFTKRTLYQYFADKADLYLSVLLHHYEPMVDRLTGTEPGATSGRDALATALRAQYAYYRSHPEAFRIMYDVARVRGEAHNPKIDRFLELDEAITTSLSRLIERGQKDGSLSTREPARMLAGRLKFLLSAAFDKLVASGASYAAHLGQTEEALAQGILDDLVHSLRNE